VQFGLSEEQRAIRDMAREFSNSELAPNAARWEEEGTLSRETLRKAGDLGFGGVYVRDDVGGTGLSRLDAAIVFEELSSGCTSTSAMISIHNMAAAMIDRYGSEDLRQRYLPKLVTLEHMASYCLTEPGAGSDAASLQTRARREGDHYVINGSKAFISGGGFSDVYVCMVRTADTGSNGVSCIVVPKDAPGLSFGKQEDKMGWRAQPTAALLFDECRVPVANLVGEEGQGFRIAMAGLDGGRINIGACSLGAARHALEQALSYTGQRKQFGQPIANFQATQFRLADMATELEAARLMIWRAAQALDDKDPDASVYCAMAKRFATDIGFEVCNAALQLHGGYGYLRDFPLERHVRDVRVHQILEGTNEIMRVVIARRLLSRGLPE
jgi:alkylation response protein AidB-like acyl-CoA dehydrogenase